MIEFILVIALITFGTLIGMSMIALRNVAKDNERLRKENTEMLWSQIKI